MENNYDKVLQLCVAQEDYRGWMTKPFVIGDKVYSTEAHIMCICPKDKLGGEYESLESYDPNNVLKFVDSQKIADKPVLTITRETLKEIESKIPKVEGYKEVGKDVQCDSCEGDGVVEFEYDYEGRTYYTEADCPICDGDGLREKVQKVKNGLMETDKEAMVKIWYSVFRFAMIEYIIEICNILDSDAVVINEFGDMKPLVVKVADVVLYVMSSFENNDNVIHYHIKP